MEILRPFRADHWGARTPRALPWASQLRAVGAMEREWTSSGIQTAPRFSYDCDCIEGGRRIMTTYLLAWNPKRWPWDDLTETAIAVKAGKRTIKSWSCGTSRRLRKGDRAFLIRLWQG